MLRDQNDRPQPEQLLHHPILRFFEYICYQQEQGGNDYLLNQISQQPEAMPALVSAMSLSDKNKAIIAFFSLMKTVES